MSMTVTNSDATFAGESLLVGRIATEPHTFLALYDFYFPRVYNYIRYRCYDPDTSDDLTAQVFERALVKLDNYNPQRGPFGAWLFAIARNVVNYHLRLQKRRRFLPLDTLRDCPNNHPSPEEVLIDLEMHSQLLQAMRGMDEREKDLISLKFAAHMTNRRIAEITGLSESNVGVILHRAVEKLRASLMMEEPLDE